MTFLLLVFAVVLGVYGLVEQRDGVVLAGAFLAASAAALNRIGRAPRRRSGSAITDQLRSDMEAQIVEKLRQTRNT